MPRKYKAELDRDEHAQLLGWSLLAREWHRYFARRWYRGDLLL